MTDNDTGIKPIFTLDENCIKHKKLSHYTSFETLNLILQNRTLMFNGLSNVNDKYEAKRNGIEKYSNIVFVSCFCNYPQEIVPFWYLYGNCDVNQKIMLSFKNFTGTFYENIYTDYFITDEGNKMNMHSKTNTFPNKKTIVSGTDVSGCMAKIKILDVAYRLSDDEVFTKNYLQASNPELPLRVRGADGLVPVADVNTFGHFKTNHWEYEKETRIVCWLLMGPDKRYNHIFLRLKDDFFKEMEIVINPWAKKELHKQVQNLIRNSKLSEDIKNSIIIKPSELTGLIKEKV